MAKTLNGTDMLRRGIKNCRIKKELGEKCVYCGCTNKMILSIDHKQPFARGGKDLKSNMQVTCLPCNWLKGALTHVEFLKYYKTLMTLHDLKKVKLQFGQFKVKFNEAAYPMTEKDVNVLEGEE